MDTTTEQLNALLYAKYRVLNDAKVIGISPKLLAEKVFDEIDPRSRSPLLVQGAAILELRQLARGICRDEHTKSQEVSESGSLFDFQLQARYPATRAIEGMDREKEEVYVLREHLTVKERRQNSARLRGEANAKIAHADALDAETDAMVRSGKLHEEEEQLQGVD